MKTRPPFALLLAVAVLSAAVLGFEIALTRVFAVLLRYHFAFLVISIAVCGLGVGGYAAYWLRRKREISLPALSALMALSIVLALALMLRVVFAHFPSAYWVAAALVLVPFSLAGAFLAEAFARYSQWSGRLYAWDLAGAAIAAFAIVGVLQKLSAIDACLLMAALSALAGVLAARAPQNSRSKSGADAILVAAATVVFTGLNIQFRFLDIPAVPPQTDAQGLTLADKGMTQPLFTEMGTPGHTSQIVDTRWSAFARTDVVRDTSMPDSFYLYTNGNVPTNMMRWDGKKESIGAIARLFPLSDWAFAIAPLQKAGSSVLSIGPGGGLDALLALHHDATKFDGAEINPSIVELMNEPQYKKFNGGIYARDDIRVVVADGRAFVRDAISKNKKYSLLFSALTKTATAGTGMALLESFIYTTNAFEDYLDVLRDDGQITVVLDNPILTARFAATALEVFKSRGVNETAAMQHIAIVHDERPGPYVFALVIQKTPFTRAQTFAMEDAVLKRGLSAIWIPNQAQRADFGPYPQLAAGAMDLSGFINFFRSFKQPLDISPCPDGRPFVLDLSLETLPVFKQLTIFALVLALGVLALSWKTPNEKSASASSLQPPTPEFDVLYVLYFLALGVGFMMVEIPLAQKLILPLGYPTLALTVILFSVLLGGGAGAWVSQRFEGDKLRRYAMACAIGVALVTAVGVLLLPTIGAALLPLPIVLRCVLAALLLLPLGFLLGTPFPSGLRLFAAEHEARVPLIWGLNGVASVVGSLLAAMGAKNFGFGAMMAAGAMIYLAAGLLLKVTGKSVEKTDNGR
jgi:hypothetical protein